VEIDAFFIICPLLAGDKKEEVIFCDEEESCEELEGGEELIINLMVLLPTGNWQWPPTKKNSGSLDFDVKNTFVKRVFFMRPLIVVLFYTPKEKGHFLLNFWQCIIVLCILK
jgi:hypothetical protein